VCFYEADVFMRRDRKALSVGRRGLSSEVLFTKIKQMLDDGVHMFCWVTHEPVGSRGSVCHRAVVLQEKRQRGRSERGAPPTR